LDGKQRGGERFGGQVGGELWLRNTPRVKRKDRVSMPSVEGIKTSSPITTCTQQYPIVGRCAMWSHKPIDAQRPSFVTNPCLLAHLRVRGPRCSAGGEAHSEQVIGKLARCRPDAGRAEVEL